MEYYHEKIETDARVPARIYYGISVRDKLHYPLHWHDNLEFDLVLEGHICGKIAGESVEVGPGEIFFVNSGELHETDATGSERLHTVTVLLSCDLLRTYCPDLDEWYFEFEKGSEQQKKLAGLLRSCADIEKEKREFYELELSIELQRICHVLLCECRKKREKRERDEESRRSTGRIKKAIAYMEEHFEGALSVQDMADFMGMTMTYFSRFFHQSTGQTFHSYLTLIRLSHAEEALRKTDLTVTQIALDNGFPNVKSFIQAFQKTYEMTPARYRRHLNAGQSFDKRQEKRERR